MQQIKHSFTNDLFNHSRPNNPKRSKFDLSRITNFTADAGMIIPFDHFITLPGDDFDISFEMVLDTLPLSAPSLTGYKVVTHWYYIEMKDLWKGWQTFITRGRTGNINLTVPYVYVDSLGTLDGENDYCLVSGYHSLHAFMGIPPTLSGGYLQNDVVKGLYLPYTQFTIFPPSDEELSRFKITRGNYNSNIKVSALPYMAYQNIVKHNYVPQNLLQDNKALFPDEGDQDWILPYNASYCNVFPIGSVDNTIIDGIFRSTDKAIRLDYLRYAIYDDDYFTSALPWLQRGDVTKLTSDVDINGLFENVELQDNTINDERPSIISLMSRINDDDPTNTTNFKVYSNTNAGPGNYYLSTDSDVEGRTPGIDYRAILQKMSNISLNLNSTIRGAFSVTANKLREVLAMSVWQERNARVNGSYNGMVYQHWLVNPRDVEHLPTYIGGTADYISFQTILQNSASTSDSPLGSTAGRGSVNPNSQFVGKFHCNDYGFIFGIMIIKPDATYSQGIERHLNQMNTFEDWVQPEFEGLSPEPIYNSELYYDYSDIDNSENNGLFGYQERYTYLKVRMNQNRGLFYADPTKERLFSAYSQARNFTSLPKLSYQFVVMSPSNIRRDMLSYPEYPMFRLQTRSDVKVVRSLSYTSEPNTFGF